MHLDKVYLIIGVYSKLDFHHVRCNGSLRCLINLNRFFPQHRHMWLKRCCNDHPLLFDSWNQFLKQKVNKQKFSLIQVL